MLGFDFGVQVEVADDFGCVGQETHIDPVGVDVTFKDVVSHLVQTFLQGGADIADGRGGRKVGVESVHGSFEVSIDCAAFQCRQGRGNRDGLGRNRKVEIAQVVDGVVQPVDVQRMLTVLEIQRL